MQLVIIVLAIGLQIFLTYKKVSPFLSLLIVALLAGLAFGMQPDILLKAVKTGVGSTLGDVILIICLGAILGKILELSGAATRIANTLISSFGKKVFAITAKAISNTGNKARKKLSKTPGNFLSSVSTFTSAGISIFNLFKNFPRKGPAIITTGIEITRPYINVLPRSALNAPTKNIGPGCGGKKQCVVLKLAAIGIATYSNGSFAVRAIEKIKGTSMIKPAL